MTGTDFHQHLWGDAFRRALERRTEPPYLRADRLMLPQGGTFEVDPLAYSPAARLAELDEQGLAHAVVSLAPTTEPTRDLVEVWHKEALQLEGSSGGRLVPLAYREARSEFVGAIVPATDFVALEGVASLFSRLEQQGQFAFVHPAAADSVGPQWRPAGISYTHQMLQAYASWITDGVRRWPQLQVVFALLGGGAAFQIERFVRRGLDPRAPFAPNIWFETSSYGERALELSLQTFGAGRHLFGSDAPIDAVGEARAVAGRFGAALEHELVAANPLTLLAAERHRWAA
jgi:hypothetical protein